MFIRWEFKVLRFLKTLTAGLSAQSEEQARDLFAIELIDQKIREATQASQNARTTLASLIQQARVQDRQLQDLRERIADLTDRARQALETDREDLAIQAARGIADMENEAAQREKAQRLLETKILHLRQSIQGAHRLLIDLKQGAASARAVRKERRAQRGLVMSDHGRSAMAEAEALIERVMGQDDPFEQAQILDEIDQDLDHSALPERLAAQGCGAPLKATTDTVLARLKTQTTA